MGKVHASAAIAADMLKVFAVLKCALFGDLGSFSGLAPHTNTSVSVAATEEPYAG
jgi:hypothetical protein